MKDDSIRNYWLGFIVAAVGFAWLIWLWRRQREIVPRPLYINRRLPQDKILESAGISELREEDDLQVIQGIGPAYASRLKEAGIRTYKQLSELTADELQEITAVTRWDPEQWINEARSLARG